MAQRTTREIAEGFANLVKAGDNRTAFETYVSPSNYIQHDPNTLGGRDSVLQMLEGLSVKHPDTVIDIKRTLVDGDMIFYHAHMKLNADDPGVAIMDLFRVEDGYIVEHWHVLQPVPVNPPNPKAMF